QHSARDSFQIFAERQLPDVTDYHAMALIQNARAALGLAAMARILADATASIDGLSGVVDHMRPRVSRRNTEAAREAMLIARLQRVIDGVRIRRDQANSRVLRIRPARLDVAGPGVRLVEVLQARIDVGTLASDVAGFDHVVPGQLAGKLK